MMNLFEELGVYKGPISRILTEVIQLLINLSIYIGSSIIMVFSEEDIDQS